MATGPASHGTTSAIASLHDLDQAGYREQMTEMNQDEARVQALQGVVERVNAWQETAPEGTIRDELAKALHEAGVTLTEEQQETVVDRISRQEGVDVDLLAADSGEGGPA